MASIARSERNGRASKAFHQSLRVSIEALVSEGVVKEVTPEETQEHPVLINRLNMVIKNSDIVRTSMLLGRELNDDADVKAVDALFAERGEKKVKLRPVVDMRESGLNASFPRSSYQSHGLSGATELMEQGGCLFSVDFATHGLRAGAATDLVDAGISYPFLKKAGRWKTDACLIYFRSEESVSQTVARLLSEMRAQAHAPPTGQVLHDQKV